MKQQSNSNALHITLWIAQVLLAVMFLLTGFIKITQPITALSAQMPFAADVPEALVRFIGIAEVAGALGLILPSLLKIKPYFTPFAALGIAVVMLLAAAFHLSRGEAGAVPMNLILGLIALFVAWGRFGKRTVGANRFVHN